MKTPYSLLSPAQRKEELALVKESYEKLSQENLKLNMARGKPGPEQLDLVSGLLTALTENELCSSRGVDARNYGELLGLAEAREYFASLLGCRAEECVVGGNASLELMHMVISFAFTHGLKNSPRPWCREEKVKWLCPAPGYDRHFKISESFGFELVTVAMTPDGPDMDAVEELIADPQVKGMWCVPKYSNPDGIVYSSETVARIAGMKPAAPDFALMWDNAYCVHEFEGEFLPFEDIISLCRDAGREDMVFEFASTSKITYPGAGISVLACSEGNLKYLEKLLSIRTIGYDKMNQLRHVRYLKDRENTLALMRRHAEVLRPKFTCVLDSLEREIAPLGIARWQKPKGGYFVSVFTLPGLAKRTLELCKAAGVVMTGAGATYPYGIDPEDSNIRIAPSYPSPAELEKAMEIFCLSLRLAALEQLGA